ncbi:hypothetical protein ABMA27_003656 [Loxostege sticticalis]|uniref:Reverse transcriptase domain-containing protein n=1 Tax=Loxostege sticticalis TaxID=481309 RepID=A0ABR3HPT2_LOXSC
MEATRQRLGDQRRAIVNNKLLPLNTLQEIKADVSALLQMTDQTSSPPTHSQITQPNTDVTLGRERMRWTDDINEAIVKCYYEVTDFEKDMTMYRKKLREKFIQQFPNLANLSEQRISDQYRAIIRNKYITEHRIKELRQEVEDQFPHSQNFETPLNDQQFETQPTLDSQITHDELNITQPNDTDEQSENTNTIQNSFQKYVEPSVIENTFETSFNKFKNIDPLERPYIPKQIPSRKLAFIVDCLNKNIIPNYLNNDQDFTTLHAIIYSAAYTAAICNNTKIHETNNTFTKRIRKPCWQIRMENKINKLRSDIGRLTQYMKGNRNAKIVRTVEEIKNKHKTHATYENPNSELVHFLDTLKQKLNATASRLKRYLTCTKRKQQNTQFHNNEKNFYRNLSSNNNSTQIRNNNTTPEQQELRQFWANIWENPVQHNNDAKWIEEINKTTNIPDMNFEFITVETFIQVINRTHNWKSPGTDNIHNYWYKKLTCTHPYIHNHINKFLETPDTLPNFITQGVTYMIPKDTDTSNPAKYRPITCLQTIYKILTSCISETIYKHLDENNILAEEQKGCRKYSKGCKEQLTIDAIVMREAFRKRKNIHTMFIDYQKAFDSVPHTWLFYVLNLYKIHPTIVTFLKSATQKWQTVLKIKQSGNSLTTDPIRIQRGIFQGDALSPLWFCLALNPLSTLLNDSQIGFRLTSNRHDPVLSHLLYMDDIKLYGSSKEDLFHLADITQEFSNDIHMQFGIDKCKTHSVERGKIQHNPYSLETGEQITTMDEIDTYKYLGFHQSRQIQQKQTKLELKTKFKQRLKLILNTHLNSKNLVKAINTYAIPVLTYSFGIITWSKTDLDTLQRTINTSLTKFRKHHPKTCTQRLVLARSEGGRGIIDIKNLHNKQITALRSYFHEKANKVPLYRHLIDSDKKLTPLNLNDRNHQLNEQQSTTQDKLSIWAQKSLHGRHRADLTQPHVDKNASNAWLRRGELFPETEAFMLAIQDQVIATRNYRKHITKELTFDLCRHCNSAPETIQHITGACKTLVQSDYKHRHDQVASIIHQYLAHKHNIISQKAPYYKYSPAVVSENNNFKIYWDRTILTDKTIHFNRPDITIHDKNNNIVYLIDIAIPNTHNLQSTVSEKISKYQDLAIELKTQWHAHTVYIVPIVISSTGVVPTSLNKSLEVLQISPKIIPLLQKAVILNTCRITRKFLSSDPSTLHAVTLG